MDIRKRFARDFQAALLDNLIGSLHPGNGACGFSLMTIDYLAAFILAVLPAKSRAWANTGEGGEPSIGVVLFKVCSQYYPTQYH
jgi:chromosome condensin MukBEF ATPase and DNA-binding subunit MukB